MIATYAKDIPQFGNSAVAFCEIVHEIPCILTNEARETPCRIMWQSDRGRQSHGGDAEGENTYQVMEKSLSDQEDDLWKTCGRGVDAPAIS